MSMISNVLRKDNEALIELYKTMKPEQRLVAFFNHSRLIYKFYQVGKVFRQKKIEKIGKKLSKQA